MAGKQSDWSRYNKKRELSLGNPSVIRLGGQKGSLAEPALRRVIRKCRDDFTSAYTKLKEGIALWRDDGNKTLRNYKIYTDAADMTLDKMEYAESLYDQYINARSESDVDKTYEAGFDLFIKDNKEVSKTAAEQWATITTEYAEEQWAKEVPPPPPAPQEVILDVADSEESSSAAEKKKYRDEAIYRPKQVLSSEDGIAFYRIWRDQATTYFKLSGHTEKEAEKQKCVLITLLDVKLAKILSQNMNDSGVITNFDNMLKELDAVFDDLYPLNGRRAALFNHRQGSENWVEWIASLGDDWEEFGMNALGLEQLKAIMAIHLTDSKPIKD